VQEGARALPKHAPNRPAMSDTLATLLDRSDAPASAPALIDGDRAIGYGELCGWAAACARELDERLPGDAERVGLLLPNVPLFPAVLHGLWRTGRAAVPLNPLLAAREVREIADDAGLTAIVCPERLARLVPAGCDAVTAESMPAAGDAGDGDAPFDPAGPEDDAVIVYTAATHGRLRGARLSHRALLANAQATIEAMEMTAADRVLAPLPFIHLFGLTVTLSAPLLAGAAVVPLPRFRPDRLLAMLAEERGPTVIAGVPGIFAALAAVASEQGHPEHRLRIAISGGAPLPLGVAREWEAVFGLPLRQGYGLTEAGPVCLFNRADLPNRPGSLGVPFPGVEVTLLDGTGRPVPAGAVGEICVRGDNLFSGYLGADSEESSYFDGHFRTGDLGVARSDGAIRFAGVLKAMYTRNGFNVYPAEVARALEEDERIDRVEVQAAPDPERESEIVLRVAPAPGATLDDRAVRALCAERLAAYKQPGRVFLD
jgi:long-chain acyl-CoA synthetase